MGADGVVASAMTLHVRSDECHAHPGRTDHFVQAVITGTAVARFAGRRKAAPAPRLRKPYLSRYKPLTSRDGRI